MVKIKARSCNMKWQDGVFYFFIGWYCCGVILLGFNMLPVWLEWANSVFIITSGILGVIYFMKTIGNKRGIAASGLIFIATFLLEYFGSSYSFLFGTYFYTRHFAPHLFGVPIAIGFAWIMVIATSHAVTVYVFSMKSLWLRAIVGALLAVGFDLVLDPVSYKVKEYWIWEKEGWYYGIPISNFIGWFLIAFVLLVVMELFFRTARTDALWHRRMVLLYGLMLGMFAFLAVKNNLLLAAALPIVLVLALIIKWKFGERFD